MHWLHNHKCDKANNVLEILHDMFENNTTRNILLKNKLNSLHLEEDGSTSDYLDKIQGVLNQLAGIGVIMTNSELITQILSTLPNSWEVLASSLMYRTTMPLSLN